MGDLAEHACAVTWWAEKIPESCIVWGWKIFQWGRLAKVLGFVGGLVILVDIVGEDRIRSMAEWGRDLIERLVEFLSISKDRILKFLGPLIVVLGLFYGAIDLTLWLFPSADSWLSRYKSWANEALIVIALIIGTPALAGLLLLVIQLPILWLSSRSVALTFRVFALAMLAMSFAIDMAAN